jgi:hypothetical protein
MLKIAGIVLLALLLVLVGMNFLVVSNVGDRLRALQADVDQLKLRQGEGAAGAAGATPGGGAAGPMPFDVETPNAFAGDGADAQSITLSESPVRQATVAVTETIDPSGARLPAGANAVVLLPGVPGQVPLGREAGCVSASGMGAWVLILEGGTLRIASRGCTYARPVRARLRGALWR